MDIENKTQPVISVILVTVAQFKSLRQTVAHLRQQTICAQLELLIVAPSKQAIRDCDPSETVVFYGVKIIPVGQIDDVDKAGAQGVPHASAPIVGFVEDHAYPDPGWAEAIVEAHQGAWAAVGSTVLNANPQSQLSWTHLLIAYGRWTEPALEPGITREVSRHNISFKKSVLEAYGDNLINYMGRAGGLLQDLLAQGHHFYLEPRARIRHVNPSRLISSIILRFNAGRIFAARRVRRDNWPWIKRLIYLMGGPLIPPLRFFRIHRELFGRGERQNLIPRVYPALMFGLLLDGLGQVTGYAFGFGDSERRLAEFEMDRIRHLNPAERHIFSTD